MIKKEVFIGVLTGLAANAMGLYFAVQFFGNGDGIEATIRQAMAYGFLGKLLSISALLNLIAFFVFIKKKQDYRARGVLLATIWTAILSFIFISK